MGKAALFIRTFSEERPKDFTIFPRPTLKNYHAFVHLLDKMLSENLNRDFFAGMALHEEIRHKERKVTTRNRGTISLPNEWLRRTIKVQDQSIFDEIIGPLREVRRIRQTPAHKLSVNAYSPTYHKDQNELIGKVYSAVRSIRLLFANHPATKSVATPPWLYEGKIRVY